MNKSQLIYRLMMFLLALILAVGGWLLSQSGFNSIQSLRQIERLSETSINAALPGEVKLKATTKKLKRLISSEHFKVPSIYYFYRYEIEKKDSDGNYYWSTQHESSGEVDFLLEDETGQIKVNLEILSDEQLDFSLPISQQATNGKHRHTEWRIETNDKIFLLGLLQNQNDIREVGFIGQGQYLPLISKYSEQHEKSDIGIKLIVMIAGGISLIAFAAYCLTAGLQIHRIIAFLFILSFSIIIPLTHLGINMLYQDIVKGEQRLNHHSNLALKVINDNISDFSHPQNTWPELVQTINNIENRLPNRLKNQVNQILLNTAFSQEKYQHQLENFPNNIIAWIYSVQPQQLASLLDTEKAQELSLRLDKFKPAETLGLLPIIVVSVGLLLCTLLSWFAFKLIRLKRHIENIPTSKSSGLVFGLSELKGRISKIETQEPLLSPLTSSQCYWFHYIVEERRGSGKNTKWVTIENRQSHLEFYCKDVHGQIKVSPKNAEIISHRKKTKHEGRMRYTEKILKLNDKVYVLGNAKIDRDKGDTLEIRGDKKERPFLITNLTEQEVMMRKANHGMLSLTTAFSCLMFACLFYLGIQGSFSPADYLTAAFIAPVYMSFIVLVLHYNDLIFLKQRASRNLSNIEVSMQKRYNLIPNIEKIVKKYMAHESGLLKQLTRLRTMSRSKNKGLDEFASQLESEQTVLTQIIAKAEDYPDLKAVALNKKLMTKLVDLENEVALMREGYNDAVTFYNTRITSVPDVFFARFFGFKAIDLFIYKERKFSKADINW